MQKMFGNLANLSIEELKNDREYFNASFNQLEEVLFENFNHLIRNKKNEKYKAYFAKILDEKEKTFKIFGITNKASFTRIYEGRCIDLLTGGLGMIKTILKSKFPDVEENIENGLFKMIEIYSIDSEFSLKDLYIMINFSVDKKIAISICKNENRIPRELKIVTSEELFNGLKLI